MKFQKLAASSLLLLLILSCGGSDDPAPGPDPDPVPDPSAATLTFPDNNSECNEGVVQNATQSEVTFQWTASQNTDSYQLHIRNLNTNMEQVLDAATNELAVTLLRGTPYEWFVVSEANGTSATASSATWKFYNEGPGVENYAPFPADVVAPARGSTVTAGDIDLEWTGSDVDDDIVDYEILFGTDAVPTASIGTTANTTMTTAVVAGELYYWQVITSDSAGNTSTSDIFDFRAE